MGGRVRSRDSMRTTDRAQQSALALVAAVAATASVGVAALARAGAGLCGHRVLVHHHGGSMGPGAMNAAAMPGLAGPVAMPDGGVCPILLYAAAVAVALCLLALIVLVAARAGAPAVLVAAARWIGGLRVGPLSAIIGLAGAVPLAAMLVSDGGVAGLPALGALAMLIAGAFAGALALATAARIVLAFARRLAVALAAAFRLLVPGADAPWLLARDPLLAAAVVHAPRRRASRAPPVLR